MPERSRTEAGTGAAAPPERSALIKGWALEEGFHRAGVAVLEPSRRGGAVRRWIDEGRQASMDWMERTLERRLDPTKVLEGGRSALCVALHYDGEVPAEATDLWRRVARYGHGRDYHDVMLAGLRRVGERIEAAFPGTRTRSYVDTGPLLERELAAAAGIGQVGKNTMLLHRSGSWFLLGEVLTTLELEPDPPLPDLCGQCTRCLEACPTDALTAPFELDSRRCISFWTIEHRGDLPADVRPLLADWVFGCDLCQEACPWNGPSNPRRSPPAPEALRLPEERGAIGWDDLLEMDHARYVEIFRGSPMKRAKLQGLQRNAAVALGNRRAAGDLEILLAALDHPDPVVRRHVAWAVGRHPPPAGRRRLLQRLAEEPDAGTRCEIQAALERPADGLPAGS